MSFANGLLVKILQENFLVPNEAFFVEDFDFLNLFIGVQRLVGGGGCYILSVRSKIMETAVGSKCHAKNYTLKSSYIIYLYFKI